MKCEFCDTKLKAVDKLFLSCPECRYFVKKDKKPYSTKGTSWEGDHLAKYLDGESWRCKVFESRLNLLREIAPKAKSILDVGSAAGLFGKAATDKFKQVGLVEPDEIFAAHSKKINPGAEHFSDISEVQKRFDIITIFDTIGYTLDLGNFIEELVDRLNPGGLFFVSSIEPGESLTNRTDLSFNYYPTIFFWEKIINDYYPLEDFRIWAEAKNFNTAAQGTGEWWRDYLFLEEVDIMNYAIYKKEKE